MSVRRAAAFALAATAWAWPMVALACPVCFQATEKNRAAFVGTTVFLSLLPLAAIGGLVFWLVRAARTARTEAAAIASVNASTPEAGAL